jgi:hypothetical protein
LTCKSILLRTALAYTDGRKRLKALVPVREYVQKNHPPTPNLIYPLSDHYQELLELLRYYGTLSSAGVVARVASNFSNIQNVLFQCLQSEGPHLADCVRSICELSLYSRITNRGHLPLLDHVPELLPQLADHKLEVKYIVQLLNGWGAKSIPNAKQLIEKGLEHLNHFQDPDLQCELIPGLSMYSSQLTQP